LYAVRLNLEKLDIGRDLFIRELRQREIGTSVHFIPIPMHPAYASLAKLPENHCPRAIALYERMISLPLYPAMTEAQVHRVIHAVKEIAAAHRVDPQPVRPVDTVAAQSD
jgi:dTDP-4-amino-4,6-dideoxygalactose transaminase